MHIKKHVQIFEKCQYSQRGHFGNLFRKCNGKLVHDTTETFQ